MHAVYGLIRVLHRVLWVDAGSWKSTKKSVTVTQGDGRVLIQLAKYVHP